VLRYTIFLHAGHERARKREDFFEANGHSQEILSSRPSKTPHRVGYRLMLTIFATPKAFRGHIDVIQRNAIKSWSLLPINPEIILFGDDEGTAEVASEFGLRHIPKVARSESGAPLVHDLFAQAEQLSQNKLLCYLNADILLLSDFSTAVGRIAQQPHSLLLVGQRMDVDITERIDFSQPGWEQHLRGQAKTTGKLKPPNAIDYFVFTKGLGSNLLPLAVGRRGWDNWFLWHARSKKAAVIDASGEVLAMHQNHDYSHLPDGSKGVFTGPEAQRNRALIGEWYHMHTTEDATHRLTPQGLSRSYLHPWLVVKRAWSHPRGMVLLISKLLTRPFRRAATPSA
jgi:hypothetical protein